MRSNPNGEHKKVKGAMDTSEPLSGLNGALVSAMQSGFNRIRYWHVSLNPGDGLIYRGCDCYHWREPFDGNHLAQVFLHYVDQNGPNTEWKYDKLRRLSRLGQANNQSQQN